LTTRERASADERGEAGAAFVVLDGSFVDARGPGVAFASGAPEVAFAPLAGSSVDARGPGTVFASRGVSAGLTDGVELREPGVSPSVAGGVRSAPATGAEPSADGAFEDDSPVVGWDAAAEGFAGVPALAPRADVAAGFSRIRVS
jgi:hypothetical protein